MISGIIFFGILIFGPIIALLFNIPELSILLEQHTLLIYHIIGVLLLIPICLLILKILFEKRLLKKTEVVSSPEDDVGNLEIESESNLFMYFFHVNRKKYIIASSAMSIATTLIVFVTLIHIDERLFLKYADSHWPELIALILVPIYYPLNKKFLE